ncbi:MAG: hypothetical protein ABJA02_03070 [Acidobacteriota bacterium]
MNKFILAIMLIVGSSLFASAQTKGDYNKGEFYVGYSNGQIDTGIDSGNSINSFLRDRVNFNGAEIAGVYNVGRFVGLKADVSGVYNRTQFSSNVAPGQTITFNTNNSLYNVLGGVQLKDNSNDTRFKPFMHLLAGVGVGRTTVKDVSCTTSTVFNCTDIADNHDTGFAGVVGGGLDIKLSDRFDLRAFQVDYNPVRTNSHTDNNLRFGIGLVIK